MRRLTALLALIAGCILASPAVAAPPNIVVIETDDQTVADLASMPRTRMLIADRGVTFDQSIVSLSQCCPSRATLLTGRYAHNHGVLAVSGPFGGFAAFDASETLAVWLQRAGYATALVGKYLNGYRRDPGEPVPPGWTEWHALLGNHIYRFYDYTLDHGDAFVTYGSRPEDYQTDVLTRTAEQVVRRRAPGDAPLFLWLNYVAPHVGNPRDANDPVDLSTAVPAARHRSAFAGVPMPRSPAFDEADVSDKPRGVRAREPLATRELATVEASWRRRQEALLAVDEGVGRVMAALAEQGELDRTLVVFTSDNGFLTGEHRVRSGKIAPYEPSIRVPLLVRGPGVPAGERRRQLVWNGDIAPTLLEAAGAAAPSPLDGRSLWPFIVDPGVRDQRAVLLQGPPHGSKVPTPRFVGLRLPGYAYVEHRSGDVELYDLERDPEELENLARRPGAALVQAALALRLDRMRRCSGPVCR